MVDRIRLLTSVLLLVVFGGAVPVRAQLQVEGVPRWGFDGKVRTGQFNLLTLDVFNSADRPWQGDLLLEAQTGLRGGDVPVLQPAMFIEPYGKRQVQFLIYLPDTSDYILKWGRGSDERIRLQEPSIAREPAVVQFSEDNTVTAGMRGVVQFPESAFPPSAAGLEGLGTVLLNHVPRWNELQRQAFRDWLYAGGTVHLYHATGGSYPEFPAGLVELNQPSDAFTLGSGRVIRHATSLQQASNEFREQPATSTGRYQEWQTGTALFSLLREMTTPEHNWPLIYLMAVVYLFLLFPVCWLIGRRRGDYRITYAAILAVVGLFSVGFHTVGRRGYGERTTINSVAIARPAADGRTLVTQWSNLFVTGGGQYLIKHRGEGLSYSTGQIHEAVLGRALNRPLGALLADVPSFSARSIVHCGVLAKQGLRLNIDKIEFDGENLKTLELSVAGGRELWGDDPQFHARVLHRDRMTPLLRRADSSLALSGSGTPLTHSLDPSEWTALQNPWMRENWTTDELYRRSMIPLIANDLRLFSHEERDSFSLPENELRIYLFTKMTDDFFSAGDISPQQAGRVLHVIKLPID